MGPVAHFLADHFPELEHPAYQSALEKITFFAVTALMIGAFAMAIVGIVK